MSDHVMWQGSSLLLWTGKDGVIYDWSWSIFSGDVEYKKPSKMVQQAINIYVANNGYGGMDLVEYLNKVFGL
jgi:hypothetical protein